MSTAYFSRLTAIVHPSDRPGSVDRLIKSVGWLLFLVSLWFVLDFALTARWRVSQIAEYQTAFADQSTGSIRQEMVSSTGILSTFFDDYQTTGPVTAMQRLKEQEAWIGVEQVDSQSLQLRAWDE